MIHIWRSGCGAMDWLQALWSVRCATRTAEWWRRKIGVSDICGDEEGPETICMTGVILQLDSLRDPPFWRPRHLHFHVVLGYTGQLANCIVNVRNVLWSYSRQLGKLSAGSVSSVHVHDLYFTRTVGTVTSSKETLKEMKGFSGDVSTIDMNTLRCVIIFFFFLHVLM